MVRTIEISGDQIAVNGDEVKVHAHVGPGRVVSAVLNIEDSHPLAVAAIDPATLSYDEWKKNFDEMCALAPVNEFPADVSREAMYLPDDELAGPQ